MPEFSDTISLVVKTADLEVVRQQIPEIAAQLEVRVDQVSYRARRPLPSCLVKVVLTGAPDRISDFQERFAGDLVGAPDLVSEGLEQAAVRWLRRRRRRARRARAATSS
jgi:hypothetical protein